MLGLDHWLPRAFFVFRLPLLQLKALLPYVGPLFKLGCLELGKPAVYMRLSLFTTVQESKQAFREIPVRV